MGEDVPLRLFTVDVNLNGLDLEKDDIPKTPQQVKTERVKERLARDRYLTQIMYGQIEVSGMLETDPDLVHIRKPFSKVSLFF